MTGMRSPPMSTLMCCIPTCHPLTGRKAQFTGNIVAPLFLYDLPLKTEWFFPLPGSPDVRHPLNLKEGPPITLYIPVSQRMLEMPMRDIAWRS